MCDDDNGPDAYQQLFRTARKAHSCCACHETINSGDRYSFASGVWDGYPDSFKHCIRCRAMLDALPNGAQLDLNCGETWADPPRHVAELAFWRPGDPIPKQTPEDGWVTNLDGYALLLFEGSDVIAGVHSRFDGGFWWLVSNGDGPALARGFVLGPWGDSLAAAKAAAEEAARLTIAGRRVSA